MSSADATIEMERKIPSKKKRKGWTFEKYHTFENRELAERFPAHIGGARTSILPALPKKEKWTPDIPEDFSSTSYTFGYTDKYPTPSDKKIVREIQLRKFAKELATRLETMPKDMLMRSIQDNWIPGEEPVDFPLEALERSMGDRSGYSLGHLAYPRGFRHLPLPPDRGKYEDKRGLIKRR